MNNKQNAYTLLSKKQAYNDMAIKNTACKESVSSK